MSYHYGDSSAAGAIGNLGGLIAGNPFDQNLINPSAHKDKTRLQKIYNKGTGTDNPFEAETFLKRTGPQLPPLAGTSNLPNALYSMGPNPMMGNVAGMQSYLALQNQINNPYGQTIPNIPGFS